MQGILDEQSWIENITEFLVFLEQYLQQHPYFGCIVGRYANRIAFGKFSIDGNNYFVPINKGSNHLHGGIVGFNRKIWKVVSTIEQNDKVGAQFYYLNLSRDVKKVIQETSKFLYPIY